MSYFDAQGLILPFAGMMLLPESIVAGRKTKTWKQDLKAKVSIAIIGFSCNESSLTQTDCSP